MNPLVPGDEIRPFAEAVLDPRVWHRAALGIGAMKTYRAPWGRLLVVMSTVSTIVCVVVAVLVWTVGDHPWVAVLPPAILLGALLFVVRGYVITGDAIEVRRLLWSTTIPVRELQSIEVQPNVMRGSMRLFGNGGLYSFTGWYRNRELGLYRAYVTDLNRTIAIRLSHRTVVISPLEPDEFVAELKARHGSPLVGAQH